MNPYKGELATIWQQGYDEANNAFGMTYDDDPASPRSVAYDEGRTAGEVEGEVNDLIERNERAR
jgi:hypothetical protein